MMDAVRARPLRALWIAFVIQLAGRLLDLRWHLMHDEFEGTTQQLEAHWLVWLGVLMTIAAAWTGRTGAAGRGRWGWNLIVASGLAYVPVAVWHFIEHANLNDPEIAHYLLAVSQLGMAAGVVAVTIARRGLQVDGKPAGTEP